MLSGNKKVQAELDLMCASEPGDDQSVPKPAASETVMLRGEAGQGNVAAQAAWGIAFYQGFGVTKDQKEGVRLLKLAADQGESMAIFLLGQAYMLGGGVDLNLTESCGGREVVQTSC